MSGECTVTPGAAWSSDPITDLKLNQTANPVVQVNESAIGLRELDVPAVAGAIIGGTVLDNWFINPLFTGKQDSAVPAYAAGQRCNTDASAWYLLSSAATASATLAAQDGGVGRKLVVSMNAGSSDATIGQVLFSNDGYGLTGKTVTISAEITNNTSVTITPRLRLRTTGSEVSFAASAQVYDAVATGGQTTISDGQTARLAWTVALTSANGIQVSNGVDIQFYVNVSSTVIPPVWTLRRPQLIVAGADVPFSASVPRRLNRRVCQAGVPGAGLDINAGYMVGDEWVTSPGVSGAPAIYCCISNAPAATAWRPVTNIVRVVNRWSIVTTTPASITTVIPLDNTIPQITEGAEVFALAIQPSSTSNRLRMRFSGFVEQSAAGYITAALFRDAVANAVYATTRGQGTVSNGGRGFEWTFDIAVPDTTAQTWRVRIGPNTGTAAWLQTNSTALFGGVMQGLFEIEEITNT
jgi:hypothetical protein